MYRFRAPLSRIETLRDSHAQASYRKCVEGFKVLLKIKQKSRFRISGYVVRNDNARFQSVARGTILF